MLDKYIKNSLEKALELSGQDILIFNNYKDNIYKRTKAIVKYDRQIIESDSMISTLADRYKFTTFSEVELNNYIAYKNHFYKVLSVDNTKNDIYILYCEVDLNKVPVFTLSVNPELNLKVGNSETLIVVAYRDNVVIDNPVITYKSSDNTIASIDNLGNVTALREGVCNIEVKFNEIVTKVSVKILERVSKLELNSYSLDLTKNDTYKINATCTIDDLPDESPTLIYSSSNNEVATVDGEGNITAIGIGNCIIYVRYNNVIKEISIVSKEVVVPVYSISSSLNTFDIRQYSASTFTVLKNGVADTDTWTITIDYNGVLTTHITIDSTTTNSIKIRNSKGLNANKLILNFVKGDINIKQEVGLTK